MVTADDEVTAGDEALIPSRHNKRLPSRSSLRVFRAWCKHSDHGMPLERLTPHDSRQDDAFRLCISILLSGRRLTARLHTEDHQGEES